MVIVGLLAAVLTTGSWIPQLVRVWRTRSTDDLSWGYLGTFASGVFLWLAQRDIALGTAYAVWTGIGAAGTFLVGIWFFGDAASLGRYLGVILIVGGVVTLKLAH